VEALARERPSGAVSRLSQRIQIGPRGFSSRPHALLGRPSRSTETGRTGRFSGTRLPRTEGSQGLPGPSGRQPVARRLVPDQRTKTAADTNKSPTIPERISEGSGRKLQVNTAGESWIVPDCMRTTRPRIPRRARRRSSRIFAGRDIAMSPRDVCQQTH
jgi:hypothetical protein